MPSGRRETVGDPSALPLPDGEPAPTPGTGLGEAEGLICGKRLAAFPAPMSDVLSLLSSGSDPTPMPFVLPSPSEPSVPVEPVEPVVDEEWDDDEDRPEPLVEPEDAEPEAAAVTCATPVASSGALSVAPAGLATVAVKATESTEFALALTGTSASRLVGASGVPGAAASVQVAVPKPVAHSGLLNTAASPLGWTDRVILTWLVDGSVQLSLQTCTLKAPVFPRWML